MSRKIKPQAVAADKRPDQDNKANKDKTAALNNKEKEFGGQDGPEPTRYGDWEKGGRCTDF